MTTNPDQTVAPPIKRGAGRPPESQKQEALPAELYDGPIPLLKCPHCGRWDQPRKDGNGKVLATGEVYCTCKLCGRRFAWLIPTVRKLPLK